MAIKLRLLREHVQGVYNENKTKLLWPIKQGAVYNKNETGQRHD